MHLLSRCRTTAARHPLAYWAVVALLGAGAAGSIWRERSQVTSARDAWGTTRAVAVAARDLAPGDPADVDTVELPEAMVPAAALAPDDASTGVIVQHVAAGEVLTGADIGTGRLSLLPAGWVAIATRADPLPPVAIGDAVQLLTPDGVLADTATVIATEGDVVTIGVPADHAAAVAAAVELDRLTIALVRPA